MPIRRKKTAPPEIPLTSTSDVAFLLLVFFLVAASNAVDKGRALELPQVTNQTTKENKNLQASISGEGKVMVNDTVFDDDEKLRGHLATKLAGVTDPSLRVVVVNAQAHVTYQRWTEVASIIESAGGILAPQTEGETDKPEPQDGSVRGAAPAAAPGGEGRP